MSADQDVGKRRQLETASSSDVLESDEQLARRLHEELNALTRHARRGAPAPAAQQHLQRSRSEKLPDTKVSRSVSKQRVPGEPDALQVSMPEGDKADKPARKRSMLNRELAMLVTDMVDSQLKPATGPRQTKSKDEQVVDQHKGNEQQQAQGIEQLLPILKHESSSSQSEQERLAMEHVQAAGADGTPQANNAQQQQQHFMARASDSGADAAGADSACVSGATSSGRDSSSSSGEADREQQHTSPAAQDQRRPRQEQEQQGRREQQLRSRQQPQQPAQSTQGKGKQPQQQEGGAVKVIKIPKLPMVEYAKKWYRAKVLKDAGSKVLLEYQGYSHEGGPFWLPKDHPRIWRGSYKGRDWKYLGDGAWEPKAGKHEGKGRRQKVHRSSSAAAGTATASDGPAAADSDTEQLASRQQRRQAQQQKQKKQSHRRASAAAAAAAASTKREVDDGAEGAVSERDTTSADQQGEVAGDADAAGPSAAAAADQAEVDSGMQLVDHCEVAAQPECVVVPSETAAPMDVDDDEQQLQEAAAEETGQTAEPVGDDGDEEELQECQQQQQADEQHEVLQHANKDVVSAEECDKATLVEAASAQLAEASDGAAATPAEVKCEAAEGAADATDGADAAAAAAAEGQPAAVAASGKQDKPRVKQDAGAAAAVNASKPAAAKGKPNTSPLLLGHTHEEMVAAAAAAVAAAAPPAPRGRSTRSGRSNSIKSAGEGASEGTSNKRGGRGGRGGRGAAAAAAQAAAAAAAAAKEQLAKQEQQAKQEAPQQPTGSGSGSGQGMPAGLHVEAGRALKHSGSSEGPLSPTSPSGGSPRVHRRKGVPRRARLDSEDLQRPTKKARGAIKPSVYCDTAMEYQQHEQQVQMQQMLEERRQQAQLQAQQQQLAWKACKGAFGGSTAAGKKSIWQMQQQGEFVGAKEPRQRGCWQQDQQQQSWNQPSPRQQTLAAAAAAAAAAECQAAVAEQQQLLLLHQAKFQGSELEDVEAACVLLGAARAREPGEAAAMADSQGSGFHLHLAQRSFSMTAADEMQLSPRCGGRQAGKRRGHNWSKPLSSTSRPPRPPAQGAGQQQQQLGFRHSIDGSISQQQLLQLQPQRRVSFSNAELTQGHSMPGYDQQEQHSYGALGSAALAAAAAAATAADTGAALAGRQGLVNAGAAGNVLSKPRNGSCIVGIGSDIKSNGKQETLRNLLDAVGQVQSASGRPDLMYPIQFGGVPMGTQPPAKDGRNGILQPLQLTHTPVSAAAATLLAAVPSLDAVQRMAMLQGQGGVLACLTGESPSLFL